MVDAVEGDVEVDFTRLKYFLAVAEELHFKRAADRLHITPPPLSKQIKVLERELGGPLFERDYHKVRLTPLGEALVDPARRVLAEVAEFRATAESLTGGGGPLRIGATAYAPSDFLRDFEEAVGRLQSTRGVLTIPGSAADVAAHLVAGHLDLGLIHLPPTDQRIGYRVVAEYQGGIAVRYDDPLATRRTVSVEDLRDREVAVDLSNANPVLQESVVRQLRRRGLSRIVHASATGTSSEIEIAAQVRARKLVMLISYVPGSALARVFAPPDFTMVPLDDAAWAVGRLALAWSKELRPHRGLEPAIAELAALLDPSAPDEMDPNRRAARRRDRPG